MNPVIRQLCDISIASLRGDQYNEPLIDEKALLVLAKTNGLIGLIYPLIKNEMSASDLSRMVERDYYAYIAADIQQKTAADLIDNLLNERGIDHIFLKGNNLKPLYPETYMRGMGDIDVLVRENARKQVKQALNKQKITLTGKAEHHDNYLYGKDVLIEVHYSLFPERHRFWDREPWNFARQLKDCLYELEKEYELVYLLSHLAKHFLSSGAGLRSVLDIGLYLHCHSSLLDYDKLKSYVKKAGLETFFTNIIILNNMLFDFNLPETLCLSAWLSVGEYESIADYIASAGIHGYGQDFNSFSLQMASHQRRNKKKFSFYLGKIFPSYRSMKAVYPAICRYKVLLPLGWVLRWFRLMFNKGTYVKIKKLFIKREEVEENISFLQKIGL